MSGSCAKGEAGWPPDDPALLLVESLIHELVAGGALERTRATAVVEIAIGARDEIRLDRGDSSPPAPGALEAILATLRLEGG